MTAAATRISKISFNSGQSCHGTARSLPIWSIDQFQTSWTKWNIAAIPCCRKCSIWLRTVFMADAPQPVQCMHPA